MRRPLLLPLTLLFRAAVAARNFSYASGWTRPQRLGWPVISVGSISVGGAGKTPLVIRLAELLVAAGMQVVVLSRGYGRDSTATERVVPDGSPQRFGDEPLMIARNAGVPVFVGVNRFAAGLLAERSLEPSGVHLLDDGFQHRQLERSVDIVLVGKQDLEDTLLPAGNLREPLSALKRASFFAVRYEEQDVTSSLRARELRQPVWIVNRRLEMPVVGERSMAFCGIARPKDFFSEVAAHTEPLGREVVSSRSFPDHHRYTSADMEQLVRLAIASRADGFVTTEKDAVKLDAGLRSILERVAALHVVRLQLILEDEEVAIQSLMRRLSS